MLESRLNKVAELKVNNFTKRRLQDRGFPVNIAKFLAMPFSSGRYGWFCYLS